MATTKTKTKATGNELEAEYDFDSWTQEDEDAALRKINDVKHIIVGGNFVGRFGDGTIVKIPLELKLSTIDELQEKFTSPVDQFSHLIRTYAGEEVADSLKDRSIIPLAILSEKFFRCLARAQEIHFPES